MTGTVGQAVLLLGLGIGAALICYWGIRVPRRSSTTAPAPDASTPIASTVSIAMPHDEPLLPLGPHRSTFQTSCTICHSTRLVLNQPPFGRDRWQTIVEKMINAYGAPVSETQQQQIVTYLTAISATASRVASSQPGPTAVGEAE